MRLTTLWLMNKYKLVLSSIFKKDLRQCGKRNFEILKRGNVFEIVLSGNKLPDKYRDHSLTGNWNTHRECHVEPLPSN